MAAGTGYYAVAVGASVLVLVSLGPLKLLSTRARRPASGRRRRCSAINLAPDGEGTRVLARIEELGGVIESVEFGDERTLDVVLRASRRSESAKVAEGVAELDDVERVQWRP